MIIDGIDENEIITKYITVLKNATVKKESQRTKHITHTSYGNLSPNHQYSGSFELKGMQYELFMYYYKIIRQYNLFDTHIIERHNNTSILFIDLDLKYETKNRQYTEEDIQKIVECINGVIQKYVNIDKREIRAFVLEKKKPEYDSEKKIYADGIHILYPDIPLELKDRKYVYKQIKKEYDKMEMFKNIKIVNKYEKILDDSTIASNGNLLYGSIKKNRKYPYKCTKIYKYDMNEIETDIYTEEEYIYILSLQRYSEEVKYKINYDEEPDEIEQFKEIKEKKEKKEKKEVIDNEKDSEYNKIQAIVSILSDKRAQDYMDWRNVGFALKSTSEKYYEIFDKFSQRCKEKYNKNKCLEFWNNINIISDGITKKSLHYWAKEDNPEEYYNIQLRCVESIIDKAINSEEYELAKVIHILFGEFYICVSQKNNCWYKFENHIWKKDIDNVGLKKLIVDVLPKKINECKKKLINKLKVSDTDIDALQEVYKKKIKQLLKNLSSISFVSKLIAGCSLYMHDADFEKKLNLNKTLLAFTNGIYDLGEYDKKTNRWLRRPYLRNGNPDDLISISVNYNYDDKITMNHPQMKNIIKYFEQIQPNKEIRHYLLKFIASIADGRMYKQKMNFWIGKKGSNGKSTTNELIKEIYGDYACTLSVSFLTEKKKASSNASPDLGVLDGRRYLELSEPSNDDVLQTTQLKLITSGNDEISYRLLYDSQYKTFYSQLKVVMLCNILPKIDISSASDGGTWRRIVAVPWTSSFVEEPDPKIPNQFLKTENFGNIKKDWRQPLMWLLLNVYYIDFIENGLNEPKEVIESTQEYNINSDVYKQFLNDQYEITNEKTDTIKITELYRDFKLWIKMNNSNAGKEPNKNEFIEQINTKGIQNLKTVFCGLKKTISTN